MEDIDRKLLQYAAKVGLSVEKDFKHFDVKFFKAFDFLPDMAMHFSAFVVKKNFTRLTATSAIKNSIGFMFYNIFEDTIAARQTRRAIDRPHVRIFPFAIPQKIHFTKDTHVTHISISISADYLKTLLREEADNFQFLLDSTNNFLMEEIMTDDMLRTVNDIVKKEEPAALKGYYYRIKAMELLLYLLDSLRKREKPAHQQLSGRDIKAIYQVRDKISSSIDKPTSIAALTRIAGMNEHKLRSVFIQVFGMGIYDYYQHLRMKEAARLIRDEKLSVSAAGYQVGFENLSHFSRVFEKHIGKKPKKYSSEVK
ncbi:helix-turn-helix transcriptional regulator [Chitinophaga sp. sic0106]|uniref:helix-turn-helix transcriptional regulator n=1 Tax=Chitinophaga sp. sic0106 TaxID=2854785 RepID=UPI001C46ED18|nr:AraC family transcriptional regulator [Chitinophaga sp. sic0106]MBV7530506.1 AraC family transcriptional regulator [Chitinophaga sp. sic0106]